MAARPSLCANIPHAGSMCLLHQVLDWDMESIRCTAVSHLDPDNPLRRDGRLAAVHAVEYASQACALHGALTAAQAPAVALRSLLATARNVELMVTDLAVLSAPLEIAARRELGAPTGAIYRFTVTSAGLVVAAGRLTVLALVGEGR